MKPVVTASEMRAIDAATIEDIGLPGAVLMENAGRAVAMAVIEALPAGGPARVGIICGAGNNGGDGYVVARVLRERGVDAELYACAPVNKLSGDARLHAQAFTACGGTLRSLESSAELTALRAELLDKQVLVDALFGTGLAREVTGFYAELIECINSSEAAVIAVDIPSGLRADDGAVLGVAVRAQLTIAMACAKVGNVGAPGFAHNGHVTVAEIGIPEQLARKQASIGLLEESDVAASLRAFPSDTHKGQRGHLLAVAGSEGKRGAGRLAALAALRAGAGLVTLAAPTIDEQAEDPIMCAAVHDRESLLQALAGKASLVIGPGMPTDAWGASLVQLCIAECELPMVLDADALNHVVGALESLATRRAPAVLTPHPGEAARLLHCTVAQVQSDRVGAVRELASRSGAVVVLKGARTCICDGAQAQRFVAINPSGGPELSTGGTGDVLAGLIGALLGQGLAPEAAARSGAYLHGLAGSLALASLGGPGLIASDLLDALPRARRLLRANDCV